MRNINRGSNVSCSLWYMVIVPVQMYSKQAEIHASMYLSKKHMYDGISFSRFRRGILHGGVEGSVFILSTQ